MLMAEAADTASAEGDGESLGPHAPEVPAPTMTR